MTLRQIVLTAAVLLSGGIAAAGNHIAGEKVIATSPDPTSVYLYTPAITVGSDGRLVVAVDYGGPGTAMLDGPLSSSGDYKSGNQVRVYLSDNHGRSWRETSARLPFMHEILFNAGGSLYMIGHAGRLVITRSDDNGETWTEPSVLESAHQWHQSCCAVDIHDGKVTLVYEQFIEPWQPWPGVQPVLLQADINSDLTLPSSWRFSEPYNPNADIAAAKPSGIPALRVDFDPSFEAPGILETNVVRVHDSGSPFYDPSGRSVVLMARANTGFQDIGVMLRGVEGEDGSLSIRKLHNWNGEEIFYTYIPGGNMKFHVAYDPVSKLYWMVHSQIRGDMNNRRRLGLSFSSDLLTWTFAGLVAEGPSDNAARHYATLAIDGDDMYVVSRSGDMNARNSHDGNIVTFHRIRNFRKLIY